MQQLGAGHKEFPIFKILFPCNLVTVKNISLANIWNNFIFAFKTDIYNR